LLIIILPFWQDIEPAPLARTISYNITGPISALGYQSSTLAQLMARYATLDPVLTRPASDKRKTPSLIAPPAAKKKRTTKKLLIQVKKTLPVWVQCHSLLWPFYFLMTSD
jgi:hypothetical protein